MEGSGGGREKPGLGGTGLDGWAWGAICARPDAGKQGVGGGWVDANRTGQAAGPSGWENKGRSLPNTVGAGGKERSCGRDTRWKWWAGGGSGNKLGCACGLSWERGVRKPRDTRVGCSGRQGGRGLEDKAVGKLGCGSPAEL